MRPSLEVLISCMHQTDHSIIERTNIQTDVVVVNQCGIDKIEEFSFLNKKNDVCKVKFISTTERGLSKSRNMALRNAQAEICLICDDDEILHDDYHEKILNSWESFDNVDFMSFQISDTGKVYSNRTYKINYINSLKIASVQIAFKRERVIGKSIEFNESIGSGVTNAGGEENLFIYDCIKAGLKGRSIPVCIGRMIEGESQWFHGYTSESFYDHGIKTKMLMGRFWASIYAMYFIIKNYPKYHNDMTVYEVTSNIYKGIFSHK